MATKYALTHAGYSIEIDEMGAELIRLEKDGINYLWDKQSPYWQRHAPVLFPIVGKLKNNAYTYKDKTYSLPQHGFARDSRFRVIEQSEHTIQFQLSENKHENYPFGFELYITYSLDKKGLTTTYRVVNTGNEKLPFSIGAHPAFKSPVNAHEKPEDYFLVFPDDTSLSRSVLNNGLRTYEKEIIFLENHRLQISEELFAKDALVINHLQSKTVSLQGPSSKVDMSFSDITWFGIWKQPGAPFVCMEPWWGVADKETHDGNIFHKEGIMILEVGGEWESGFRIDLDVLT